MRHSDIIDGVARQAGEENTFVAEREPYVIGYEPHSVLPFGLPQVYPSSMWNEYCGPLCKKVLLTTLTMKRQHMTTRLSSK